MLSNQKMLKIVNPLMAIAFLTVATLGIIITLGNFSLIDVSGQIYAIHKLAGKLFILLAIFHIVLNFGWIKINILGIEPKPARKKK